MISSISFGALELPQRFVEAGQLLVGAQILPILHQCIDKDHTGTLHSLAGITFVS